MRAPSSICVGASAGRWVYAWGWGFTVYWQSWWPGENDSKCAVATGLLCLLTGCSAQSCTQIEAGRALWWELAPGYFTALWTWRFRNQKTSAVWS